MVSDNASSSLSLRESSSSSLSGCPNELIVPLLLPNTASPFGAAKLLSLGPVPKTLPNPLPNVPNWVGGETPAEPKADSPAMPKLSVVDGVLRPPFGTWLIPTLDDSPVSGSVDFARGIRELKGEEMFAFVNESSAPKGEVVDESAANPEAANAVLEVWEVSSFTAFEELVGGLEVFWLAREAKGEIVDEFPKDPPRFCYHSV